MRKIIIWSSCLCFFLGLYSQVYAKGKPTYQELIQEQLMIYELNRTTEKNQTKIKQIKSQMNDSAIKIREEQTKVKKLKKEVKETLLSYYEGDVSRYGETLATVKSAEEAARLYQFVDVSLQDQEKKLNEFQLSYKKLKSQQMKLKKQQSDYKHLNQNVKKRLHEIKEKEENFQRDIQTADNIKKAKKEVQTLLKEWKEKGLPLFSLFFKSMNTSINHISSYVSKDDIKAKGFLTYEVAVKENEINRFLKQENSLFQDVSFSLKKGTVQGKGTYKGLSISVTGHFVLTQKHDILFKVDQLSFQGISLPSSTIEDFEKQYHLEFSPRTVFPQGKVKKLTVLNHKLVIEVGLN